MRSLEQIDRDIEIAWEDAKAFIRAGRAVSPVLDDDLDELYDERKTVVRAMQNAGLKRYEMLVLPKPYNTTSSCAASYKLYAKSEQQAFDACKKQFLANFAVYGVTEENFDREYDCGITRGEKIK